MTYICIAIVFSKMCEHGLTNIQWTFVTTACMSPIDFWFQFLMDMMMGSVLTGTGSHLATVSEHLAYLNESSNMLSANTTEIRSI